MANSLAGIVLLLAAASVAGQQPAPATVSGSDGEPGKTIFFRKEPSRTSTSTWRSAEHPSVPNTMHFTKEATPQPVPGNKSASAAIPATKRIEPAPSQGSAPRPATPGKPMPPASGSFGSRPALAVKSAPPSVIQRTGMQQRPPADARPPAEEAQAYQQPLDAPPGPDRLFRLESEAAWQARLRQETKSRPKQEPVSFPEDPVLSKSRYVARAFAPMQEYAEPGYVCYHRLLFEEQNSERYGWELGYFQPFLSAGYFFKDVVLLPYHLAKRPCRKYECSAGYCLPGDPVPYLLYPPELSVTGTAFEAGMILALVAIFP